MLHTLGKSVKIGTIYYVNIKIIFLPHFKLPIVFCVFGYRVTTDNGITHNILKKNSRYFSYSVLTDNNRRYKLRCIINEQLFLLYYQTEQFGK